MVGFGFYSAKLVAFLFMEGKKLIKKCEKMFIEALKAVLSSKSSGSSWGEGRGKR